MAKYLLKRLLNLIPVILIISLILFMILKLMPGDTVSAYLGQRKVTEEQRQMMIQNLGLDQPIFVQYVKWLWQSLQGNLGESLIHRKPVVEIMGSFIWNSFMLNIVAFIAAFAVSIPVGIKSAVKKYSLYDNAWNVFSLMGISLPSFFFGLLLIFGFGVFLQIFPLNGMVTAGYLHANGFERALDILWHMVLPATVLMIIDVASLTKYMRNSMLEVIKQDYVRTAKAKGLKDKVVIYRHAFRNAMLPLVTLLGLYIPGLFSGAVILETIFIWPGIGRVLFEAITRRDYMLLMASNMMFAVLLLIGNLLADIGYAMVDPRIKY